MTQFNKIAKDKNKNKIGVPLKTNYFGYNDRPPIINKTNLEGGLVINKNISGEKSGSVTRFTETNIYIKGKKMFVPEGLEVIPIFTKEYARENITSPTKLADSFFEDSFKKSKNQNVFKLGNLKTFSSGLVERNLEKSTKIPIDKQQEVVTAKSPTCSGVLYIPQRQRATSFHDEIDSFPSAGKITGTHSPKLSKERLYNCESCTYTSNNIPELRKHKTTHKSVKPYVCFLCNFTCNVSSNMSAHVLTHTGKKRYKCTDCKFASVSKSKLLKHAHKHTGKFPFQCEKCPYGTLKQSSFTTHMNVHNGLKMYKCEFCDYTGADRVHLKRHVLVHSDCKPYKCKECSYSTREKTKLKRHMKVHITRSLNKCPHCSFTNFHISNFKRHLATHKTYTCAECETVCMSRGKFIKHLKSHSVECDNTTVDGESEEELEVLVSQENNFNVTI